MQEDGRAGMKVDIYKLTDGKPVKLDK